MQILGFAPLMKTPTMQPGRLQPSDEKRSPGRRRSQTWKTWTVAGGVWRDGSEVRTESWLEKRGSQLTLLDLVVHYHQQSEAE